MMSAWLLVILCVINVVKCQYQYPGPEILRDDRLGYDIFGRAFSKDDEIPGIAGRDYPVYAEVPNTGFRCDRQGFPGYYADPRSECQAFYICQRNGQSDSFLCPNGTVFNQEWLVCDWWYNFDCSRAESSYYVNEQVVRAMEAADRNRELERFGNRAELVGRNEDRAFENSGRDVNSEYFGRFLNGFSNDNGGRIVGQQNGYEKQGFPENVGASGTFVGPFGRRVSMPSRSYLPGRR